MKNEVVEYPDIPADQIDTLVSKSRKGELRKAMFQPYFRFLVDKELESVVRKFNRTVRNEGYSAKACDFHPVNIELFRREAKGLPEAA